MAATALAPRSSTDSLVGKFFTGRETGSHGIVRAQLAEGYIVQLFSGIWGESSDLVLFPFSKMKDWRFYSPSETKNIKQRVGLMAVIIRT